MQTLTSVMLLIMGAGAFGGLLAGMVARSSHKVRFPFWGGLVEIGFVGDVLVGAAASLGAFFVAAPLLNMSLAGERAVDDWVRIISFGVLAGLIGVRFLTGTAYYLNEKIAVLDHRVEDLAREGKVGELVRRADSLAAAGRLEHALATYDEALRIDPRNESALVGKAQIFGERSQWDKAIGTVSRILDLNPSSKRAYYERARYKNMAGKYAKEDVLQDLRSAVTLEPHYKHFAAYNDPYFEGLRQDEGFRQVVG